MQGPAAPAMDNTEVDFAVPPWAPAPTTSLPLTLPGLVQRASHGQLQETTGGIFLGEGPFTESSGGACAEYILECSEQCPTACGDEPESHPKSSSSTPLHSWLGNISPHSSILIKKDGSQCSLYHQDLQDNMVKPNSGSGTCEPGVQERNGPREAASNASSSSTDSEPLGGETGHMLEDSHHDNYPPWWHMPLVGLLCTLGMGSSSCITVLLWSDMGFGEQSFRLLRAMQQANAVCACLCAMLLLVMYLFDVFWPPHLPGEYLVLWTGDRFHGRILIGVAVVLAIIALLIMSEVFPTLAVIFTLMFSPGSAILVHMKTRKLFEPPPCDIRPGSQSSNMSKGLVSDNILTNIALLCSVNWQEEETRRFYKATLFSFILTSAACSLAFVYWVSTYGDTFSNVQQPSLSRSDKELLYLTWGSPIMVATWNLVFGIFVLLRLSVQKWYCAANKLKTNLVAEGVQLAKAMQSQNKHHHQAITRTLERLREQIQMAHWQAGDFSHVPLQDTNNYQNLHIGSIAKLMVVGKFVVCFVVFELGAFCIIISYMSNMFFVDQNVASIVILLMGALLISFVFFVITNLATVMELMTQWMTTLSVWQHFQNLLYSDWTFSFGLIVLAPVLVCVLILSAANQYVRRWRQLPGYDFSKSPFTDRVARALEQAGQRDTVSIIVKCYSLCLIYFLVTTCPIALNIILAWSVKRLKAWPFSSILATSFLIGIIAFLLPPVPGMTVYMFAGLMISSTCQCSILSGAVINTVFGLVLKLVACWIQQVVIGGLIGKLLWVRRLVGVHKVTVRCIEAVLRRPGLQIGKIGILCGGPDWPTSVLAGILNLSVTECLVGTLPIIMFTTPCGLIGTFYMKAGTSPSWDMLLKLMYFLSFLSGVVFWAIAAWAMYGELEKNGDALMKPLPANVELEWLDYHKQEMQRVCGVTWPTIPLSIRLCLGLGATLQIIVCQFLFFQASMLFAMFRVSDSPANLKFLGQNGIIKPMGMVICVVYGIAWVLYGVFSQWRSTSTKTARLKTSYELSQAEPSWKANFLQRASEAGTEPTRGSSPAHCVTPEDEEQYKVADKIDYPTHEEPCAEPPTVVDLRSLKSQIGVPPPVQTTCPANVDAMSKSPSLESLLGLQTSRYDSGALEGGLSCTYTAVPKSPLLIQPIADPQGHACTMSEHGASSSSSSCAPASQLRWFQVLEATGTLVAIPSLNSSTVITVQSTPRRSMDDCSSGHHTVPPPRPPPAPPPPCPRLPKCYPMELPLEKSSSPKGKTRKNDA